MKWYCRRDGRNSAVWIAIMAVLISTNGATAHAHHGRSWLAGVVLGASAALAAGVIAMRRRRDCL